MQEHEVTAAGTTYHLPEPFFVLSTQNPIEQEGTYPLPEAQLDRFMFELRVEYPSADEEEEIVEETTGEDVPAITPVLGGPDLITMQNLVRRIPAPKTIVRAAVRLARMTRPNSDDAPSLIKEYVDWGAGPRASQYMVLGAKARAALDGRPMADLDDIHSVALAVLRHRLMVNFAAEAAGRSAQDVCRELIQEGSWMAARP
jgi:MoxR-like ATPase